jgi:hypothetical protein
LPQHALSIGYSGKYIEARVSMKFLGYEIDNLLNWTNHIVKLIPKLSEPRYAVRSMSATLTLSNRLFRLFSLYNDVWHDIGG